MARLIDGDALGNRFIPKQCYFTEDILYKIATSPAVDAAPVKHGKWNHIGTLERYVGMNVETCSEFRCSVCDSPQTFFAPIAHYNYCPICGAKMDLEETP